MGPRGRPLLCASTLTLEGRGMDIGLIPSLQWDQVGEEEVQQGLHRPSPSPPSSHHADTAHAADSDMAWATIWRRDSLREEEVHLVIILVRVVSDPGSHHKLGVWARGGGAVTG